MEEKIRLSIIIPVYNVEEYLRECVKSILNQDYKDYELILVDDGSTDSSGQLCDEFAKNDDRVKVMHQINSGHTIARQNGVKQSKGDYILLIDSDDWIDAGMLTEMMNISTIQDVDIVQCSYRSVKNGVGRDETPIFEEGFYDKQRLQSEVYPRMIYTGEFYRFGIAPNMWNKIFKRELIEQFLYQINPAIRSGEDGLVTFQSFYAAKSAYIINKCMYNYRSRVSSMCRITDDRRIGENHLLFNSYQNSLLKESILKEQLYRYVVYQTLQAVSEALKNMKLSKVVSVNTFLNSKSESIEAESIQNVSIREIRGKKNKLLLLRLRLAVR